MSRNDPASRRSVTRRGGRVLLALVVAVIGYVSVADSLANAVRAYDPQRAYAISPGNAQALSSLAEKRFVDGSAPSRSEAARLAQAALQRDPTVVGAVATLGLQAQVDSDPAAARRLFSFAQRLSRRNLQSQVWAIEDAVSRGDIPGALHHYDIALRTSKRAPDILFPILSNAITEPSVRDSLVKTLAARPVWGPYFVSYVAGNGSDRRATAQLFTHLLRIGVHLPPDAVAGAVNGLLADDAPDVAWRFYATTRPGADRRRSRDPWFATDVAVPTAFDWTPVNDGGLSTSIQRNGARGLVEFAAPSGVGGTVLTQTQVLPSGRYRLIGRATGIVQPARSAPYWTLTCANGRELSRIEVPAMQEAGSVFGGLFEVPAGCPVQTLALVVRPSDEVAGSTGQIEQMRLVPAG